MIRAWLKARRARIDANLRAAEDVRRKAERVRSQWPKINAHAGYATRRAAINHVGRDVVAMIHDRRTEK